MASQSHRMHVADSSFSRHSSEVGSFVNPSLKRCPFRCQCPVNSPTTHLNWSLFNFNRSFVLLAEGPRINPFALFTVTAMRTSNPMMQCHFTLLQKQKKIISSHQVIIKKLETRFIFYLVTLFAPEYPKTLHM
jgi:hypothetical protein